jgi:hypothetical protein
MGSLLTPGLPVEYLEIEKNRRTFKQNKLQPCQVASLCQYNIWQYHLTLHMDVLGQWCNRLSSCLFVLFNVAFL